MKLRNKILLALTTSLAIGYFLFFIIYLLFQPLQMRFVQDIVVYNCFTFAYIGICVCVSLLIFYLLIGKRIKYISYLSQQVIISPDKIVIKGNDEISILAGAIKEMFLKVQESHANERKLEQEKYNLITSLSHDIRTPLTAIIGYLELIKKDVSGNEYLDIACNRSKQLSVLVNRLFDYVKISDIEYKINAIEFDLVLLLQQLLAEYQLQFEQNDIKVNSTLSGKACNVVADPDSVFRIFDNLFQNVLKYAETYLLIGVEETEDYVIVKLENDTGRTFDINRISERFYKGKGENLNSTGLGLFISRTLTEKNGGLIEFDLTDGRFVTSVKFRNGKTA